MASPPDATRSESLGGPGPVDRSSALPLWAQIHADLGRRLSAGEFSAAFPSELTLVEQYGVSRATIREAVRRLRSEGLVIAGRGRAPRAAPRDILHQPVGALYSLFASVEAAGRRQRSQVRARQVVTDPAAARRLQLPEDDSLLYLERLRFVDDEPLALDQVWLPAAPTRALLDVDFTHTALYRELARCCDIRLSGGQEEIRAVTPSRAERTLLGLPADVAAFRISRLGHVDQRPFEWRQSLVRGDRFAVTAQFSVHEGYRLDLSAR